MNGPGDALPPAVRAVTRRSLLAATALGLAGAVAACSDGRAGAGSEPPSGSGSSAAGASLTPGAGSATAAVDGPGSTAIGPSASIAPSWARLATQLSGRLVRPGDAGYDTARLTANPRYDSIRPEAIARCTTAEDVAATIRWARDAGVGFSVRSGGHCYGGWSTGPHLVLDLSAMNAVTVDPGGRLATVTAGARLVDVYRGLASAGVGIPAGSCPSVAMAGLALGGGIGVLSRSWGLTCDTVTGCRLVTADGVIHQVDAAADPELLWAARGGGGGSLGVVTSFTVTTRPAPDLSLFFIRWPWSSAVSVADAWQHWAPAADRRLWSTCKLLTTPASARVVVAGAWSGPSSGLDAALNPLLAGAGAAPVVRSARRHGFLDAMLTEAGCRTDASCHLPPGGTLARESEAATSHLPAALASPAALATLAQRVERMSGTPGLTEAGVSLDALGGAVAELAASGSAFVHRGSPFSVQYTATWTGSRPPSGYDAVVRAARDAMTPHFGPGAYVNYPDAAVPDWRHAYWGSNYPRLQQVKRRVDPDDVFHFAQSIEP